MREYLFRGIILHPTNILNGWFYGDLIHFADGLVAIRQQETGEIQHVISETVGQFTGITDKNGTRIFKGDIVNILIEDKIYLSDKSRIIIFNNGSFGFISSDKRFVSLSSIDYFMIKIEVIGNIHEK